MVELRAQRLLTMIRFSERDKQSLLEHQLRQLMSQKPREWVKQQKVCCKNKLKRKTSWINSLLVLKKKQKQLSTLTQRKTTNNSVLRSAQHCTQVLLHTESRHSSKSSLRIFHNMLIQSKLKRFLNISKQCLMQNKRKRKQQQKQSLQSHNWKVKGKHKIETITQQWSMMSWETLMEMIMEIMEMRELLSQERMKLSMTSCESLSWHFEVSI